MDHRIRRAWQAVADDGRRFTRRTRPASQARFRGHVLPDAFSPFFQAAVVLFGFAVAVTVIPWTTAVMSHLERANAPDTTAT